MELSVCPIALGNRAAFGDAGILGQTALEFEPSGKAAEEILRGAYVIGAEKIPVARLVGRTIA